MENIAVLKECNVEFLIIFRDSIAPEIPDLPIIIPPRERERWCNSPPLKLNKLSLCGYVYGNLSGIAAQCPRLESLVINSSKIDLMFPAADGFPQTINPSLVSPV